MMVGNNLKDTQLQQIVDKTIQCADKDADGKISFEEFCNVSHNNEAIKLVQIFFFFLISDSLILRTLQQLLFLSK